MNGHGFEMETSVMANSLIADAIRLIGTDKELGESLLSIKRTAIRQATQQASPCDQQCLQSEVRLARAGLIVRNGSSSWVLTDLGQQVSTYLSQHDAAEELSLMYGHLDFTADSILLDLGCGSGPALVYAGELPTSPRLLIGIDIDRPSLIAARAFLGIRQRRCLLIQADLAALPIRTEAVSHVCCRLSLPYVSQYDSMGELGRVLAPGGHAFLQVHPSKFYMQLLLDEFGNWKRVVLNLFCLLNGFVFSVLRIQLRIYRPSEVYQELYQTLRGISHLLKRHGIDVLWHEDTRLLRMFGKKRRRQ